MNRKKLFLGGFVGILVFALLFLVYAVVVSDVFSEKKVVEGISFYEIDPAHAMKFIKKSHPLILDVRTEKEFKEGHINLATNIPLAELEHRLIEIRDFKNKKVFLYCRSGNRSVTAAVFLGKNGFKNVYHLKGGTIAWVNAGYELIKIGNINKISFP